MEIYRVAENVQPKLFEQGIDLSTRCGNCLACSPLHLMTKRALYLARHSVPPTGTCLHPLGVSVEEIKDPTHVNSPLQPSIWKPVEKGVYI